MNLDSPHPVRDQKERQNSFLEVVSAEKQLWALIHSKGLVHTDTQESFHKVRSAYEKIILNDHEVLEFQDVEYSLWKLHYKHIDEFRKRIRQSSFKSESVKSQNVSDVENSLQSQFKSFLLVSIEFYQGLIKKLRRSCGLPEEPFVHGRDGLSFPVKTETLHQCQYLCHRFLVCLGDLARYCELCKKPDFHNRSWSFAASNYFKALMIWPDGGNPQNQLALLATYVGDEFLALYHCVRSLAVKEPFPDAWDNLILLFEKNRLSPLRSLSNDACFDFLKPSERSKSQIVSQPIKSPSNGNGLEATDQVSPRQNDLWSLFVRMTSFFFMESSLEHFPCTFASTMRELEVLVMLDDTKLKATLESYQPMDPDRIGPYRALQAVSILIFVIHRLEESPEPKESKAEEKIMQCRTLTQLSWTSTFIFMGRLLERCLKNDVRDLCPVLPAVLVFVEWLTGSIGEDKTYGSDEKVLGAMSYFFCPLVDLLNRFQSNEVLLSSPYDTALWEDFELRGFAPVANAHVALDFETHWENMRDFARANVCRAHRIFRAGIKIAERSKDSGKWIFFDKLKSKFYTAEPIVFADQKEVEAAKSGSDLVAKESQQCEQRITKENEREEISSHHCVNGNSLSTEEEEVILFKPITRYNSAPISAADTTTDKNNELRDETPSDECLRRASSLFTAQSQSQAIPINSYSESSDFRGNQPLKPPEHLLKDSPSYPTGPPSLNAWVLDRENMNIEKDKGRRDFSKHCLSTIKEESSDFAGLSVNEIEDSPFCSRKESTDTHYASPSYSSPLPSAPLLPEDASWFSGNETRFYDCKSSDGIKDAEGILGAPPLSSHTNWSPTHGALNYGTARIPGLIDRYPPLGMSSSEWLHHYTSSQNLGRANSHMRPIHYYAPPNTGYFHDRDASGIDVFEQLGSSSPLASTNQMVYLETPQLYSNSPLVYGADGQRRENLFLGYQRLSPYVCGAGTDVRVEQPQLLQYLKERERQLQQESQVRGPAYMRN